MYVLYIMDVAEEVRLFAINWTFFQSTPACKRAAFGAESTKNIFQTMIHAEECEVRL